MVPGTVVGFEMGNRGGRRAIVMLRADGSRLVTTLDNVSMVEKRSANLWKEGMREGLPTGSFGQRKPNLVAQSADTSSHSGLMSRTRWGAAEEEKKEDDDDADEDDSEAYNTFISQFKQADREKKQAEAVGYDRRQAELDDFRRRNEESELPGHGSGGEKSSDDEEEEDVYQYVISSSEEEDFSQDSEEEEARRQAIARRLRRRRGSRGRTRTSRREGLGNEDFRGSHRHERRSSRHRSSRDRSVEKRRGSSWTEMGERPRRRSMLEPTRATLPTDAAGYHEKWERPVQGGLLGIQGGAAQMMAEAMSAANRKSHVEWPVLDPTELRNPKKMGAWQKKYQAAALEAEAERRRGINSPFIEPILCIVAGKRARAQRRFWLNDMGRGHHEPINFEEVRNEISDYCLCRGAYAHLAERRFQHRSTEDILDLLCKIRCETSQAGGRFEAIDNYFAAMNEAVADAGKIPDSRKIIAVALNRRFNPDSKELKGSHGIMPVVYRKDLSTKIDGGTEAKRLKMDWKFFQKAVLEDARDMDDFHWDHSEEIATGAAKPADEKSGWSKSKKRRVARKAAKAAKATATKGDGEIVCHKCKKKGHIAPECPEIECYACKEKGHISTNPKCPKFDEKKNRSARAAHSTPKEWKGTCFKCGGAHKVLDCKDATEEEKKKPWLLKKKSKASRVGTKVVLGKRTATAMAKAAIGRTLVDETRREMGFADGTALASGIGGNVMEVGFYLDDGCTPDNATSTRVAELLSKGTKGATVVRVEPFMVELAVDEGQELECDTVLVIEDLKIPIDDGYASLKNVRFNILPGQAPELIIGRVTMKEGLGLTSMIEQLSGKKDERSAKANAKRAQIRAVKRLKKHQSAMENIGEESALNSGDAESDDFGFTTDASVETREGSQSGEGASSWSESTPDLIGILSEPESDSEESNDDKETATQGSVEWHFEKKKEEETKVLIEYLQHDARIARLKRNPALGDGVGVDDADNETATEQRVDGRVALGEKAFSSIAKIDSFDCTTATAKHNVITSVALNTIHSDDYSEVDDAKATVMDCATANILRVPEQGGKQLQRAVRFSHVWYDDTNGTQSTYEGTLAYVVEADAAVFVLGSDMQRVREDQERRVYDSKLHPDKEAALKADREAAHLGLEKVFMQARESGASEEFLGGAQKLLDEMSEVFRTVNGLDPLCKAPPLRVELNDDAPTHWCDHYRKYSMQQRDAMKQHLDMLLKAGKISKSTTPYVGSVVMVKKSNGSWRLAVDLRKANSHMVQRFYLMPHVAEIIQRLGGAAIHKKGPVRCCFKLDVLDGFWNFGVHEDGRKIFGFATPFGVYEWNVMPQGGASSAQHFQAVMHDLFHDLNDDGAVIIIDDILGYGRGHTIREAEQDMLALLRVVLERLLNFGLKLHPKKFQLFATQLNWAGYDIKVGDDAGFAIEQRRVQAITEMAMPTTLHELGQLYHIAVWCQTHIVNFAVVMRPIEVFMKETWAAWEEKNPKKKGRRSSKNSMRIKIDDFGWDEEMDENFKTLQLAMVESLRLSFYNPDLELGLVGDASEEHGAVCWIQFPKEELELPFDQMRVTLLTANSWYWKGAEMNWGMVDKEGGVLIKGMRMYPHFADAAKFHVFTDHKNLVQVFNPSPTTSKVTSFRRARWVEEFAGRWYSIRHVPGDQNNACDYFSRQGSRAWKSSDFIPGTTAREGSTVSIQPDENLAEIGEAYRRSAKEKQELQRAATVRFVEEKAAAEAGLGGPQFCGRDVNIAGIDGEPFTFELPRERFPSLKAFEECQGSVTEQEVKKHGLKVGADGSDHGGLWTTADGCVYVPKAEELRARCAIVAHQGVMLHRKVSAMTTAIKAARCWWPGIEKTCKEIIQLCLCCVWTQEGTKIPRATTETVYATVPGEALAMDFLYIGPSNKGEKYILVLKDLFSQRVRLVNCDAADSEEAASAIIEWCADFGVFEVLTSDQGSHFVNWVVGELADKLGFEHHVTTVYNARSNGSVERVNREFLKAIRALRIEQKTAALDWTDLTKVIQFGLNATPIGSLNGLCPLEIDCGRVVRLPLSYALKVGADIKETTVSGIEPKKVLDAVEKLRKELTALQQGVNDTRGMRAAKERARRRQLAHPHKVKAKPKTKGEISVPEDGNQTMWFRQGQFVQVAERNNQDRKSKLEAKWRGPYMIEKMVHDHRALAREVVLDGDRQPRLIEVASDRMRLWAEKDYKVPYDVLEGAQYARDVFELDGVHDWRHSKLASEKFQLLVKWKGYELDEDADSSWVNVDEVYRTASTLVNVMTDATKWKGTPLSSDIKKHIAALARV